MSKTGDYRFYFPELQNEEGEFFLMVAKYSGIFSFLKYFANFQRKKIIITIAI